MRRIIEFLKKLGNWLSRFFRWLIVEPNKIWITLLPIFVGVIFCWLIPVGILNGSYFNDTLEARFGISGLFLELLGIGTVVKGLNETLKLFLDEHLLDMVVKWFKRFPKFGEHRTIVGSMNATNGSDSCSAIGTVPTTSPDTTTENKVAFLEEQFKQLHSQVQGIRRGFENESRILSDALNTERNERESGHKQVQQALREFAVGDAYIELMGIVWLIIGAFSATASTELAKLFG